MEEQEEIVLSSLQNRILNREKELSSLDTITLAKEVIIKAIANEEAKTNLPRARINLAGIASLLKLLTSIDGVEKRLEADTELNLPDDVEEALQFIIKNRSLGKIASIQANDIANLLEKRRTWVEMVDLSKKVKALLEIQETERVGQALKITKREDVEKE